VRAEGAVEAEGAGRAEGAQAPVLAVAQRHRLRHQIASYDVDPSLLQKPVVTAMRAAARPRPTTTRTLMTVPTTMVKMLILWKRYDRQCCLVVMTSCVSHLMYNPMPAGLCLSYDPSAATSIACTCDCHR